MEHPLPTQEPVSLNDSPILLPERPAADISRGGRSGEIEEDENTTELEHGGNLDGQRRKRTSSAASYGSRSPSRSKGNGSDRDSFGSPDSGKRQRFESQELEEPITLNYKPLLLLKGHKRAVAAVKFSPDGKRIASCSADGTIRIWDARSGEHLHVFEGHLAGISTISWSPDSTLIASGSDDKMIRLWDVETGKPLPLAFIGHHNYVHSIAFSPKGNMLASGSFDESLMVWDVRGARLMRTLPAHSDPVRGVNFVRDGTLIVSCSSDGLIRLWDASTGQCLRTIIHEDNAPVVSVCFSPNGRYILAWTLDSSIRLWNYVEGRCIKTYQGHLNKEYSTCGAFGVYGGHRALAYIASGSEDGSIWFWDVGTKRVLQKLEGHQGVVLCVDVHPSEPLIASAGVDHTIRIWRDTVD